jgi:hypothetical protein
MFYVDDENNIYLTRGDSATLELTIYDDEGEIYTPTENDVIVLTIKTNVNNVEYKLRKTFENLQLIITPQESARFNFGEYLFDIRLINDTLTDTFICDGVFTIGGGTNG